MEINSSFATDVGRKRKVNEDSVLSNDWLKLYVVADGMGGHSFGDVASQTAVELIMRKVEADKLSGTLDGEPARSLVSAIELANKAITEMGKKLAGQGTMGTTVAGVIFAEDRFYTAHVGDSRVYRLRGTQMDRLTVDHSLVEEQVAKGLITPEQALTAPNRNVITRALGLGEDLKVDVGEYAMEVGDFILVCSDGLNGMISDNEIRDIILEKGGKNLNEAVMDLVEHANLNGGKDNVTVVLLNIGE